MVQYPAAVDVRDVGPRDGLQNEEPVSIDERVQLIDALAHSGIGRVEAVSFVRADAIPAMAGADEVMARIERVPGVRYGALVPNLRGAELAVATAPDDIEVVVSASETHNQRNVRRSVEESLAEIVGIIEVAGREQVPVEAIVSTSFGCPYEGDVAPERVALLAWTLYDSGVSSVSFGDTTGMATPRRVDDVIDALAGVDVDAAGIGLHFHDTRGTGLANVLAGLSRGVTHFDASIGGLGGCPYVPGASGNIVTEDLVHMLGDMGIETGIDLHALLRAARLATSIVGRELPSALLRAGPRLEPTIAR